MKIPHLFRFIALFSLLFVVACGEKEKEIIVQSIAISQPSAELQIGETLLLTATVAPSNASYDGMTWTSTNPKVASVSGAGLVSALSEGNTTITATAGGKAANCSVTVIKGFVAVTSISLNKTVLEMIEGDTETLTASVLPDDATDKTVTWTSSDDDVVTVNDGVVSAVSAGEATITAKAGDKTAMCSILVNRDTSNDAILFSDVYFKAYCVENFDLNGDGEVSYSEANRVTAIDVKTERIQSLGGVEYFSNLESLICSPDYDGSSWSSSDRVWHLFDNEYNEVIGGLTTLDLSKNVLLTHLCVSGNQLTSLDISKNKALQYFDCSYNLLSSLDVLSNKDLTFLNCEFNNISELDVSPLSSLIELICSHNRLGSIDVSQNILLKYFECDTNFITSLDLSNNTLLVDLNCSYNQLARIDVSMHPSLWRINCTYNKLSSLDVSHNPSLKYLKCAYNQISLLDVSLNPALSGLNCTGNSLIGIDVSNNPVLSDFQCKDNPITLIWLKRGQTIRLFVYPTDYVTIKYVGPEAVPEAIDLGLPSGLKWASFNLGASTPEEYGDQYAWGEIDPYYSSQGPYTWRDGKENGYNWASYKWCMGDGETLTKYCNDSTYGYNGFTDDKTVLDLEDDAAHVKLGGFWRMPTDEEWAELMEDCVWTKTTQNGVRGLLVTGPNGNSIFLPSAGYRIDRDLYPSGSTVLYWSSSLSTDGPYFARYLYFDSNYLFRRYERRSLGFSVRPVYAE